MGIPFMLYFCSRSIRIPGTLAELDGLRSNAMIRMPSMCIGPILISGLDQGVAKHVVRQFGDAVQVEFLHDVAAMGRDRANGDVQGRIRISNHLFPDPRRYRRPERRSITRSLAMIPRSQ